MSEKKRRKKAGEDTNKRNQRRRDRVSGKPRTANRAAPRTRSTGTSSTIELNPDGTPNLSPAAARRKAARENKGK
jgi:hypothetical protein